MNLFNLFYQTSPDYQPLKTWDYEGNLAFVRQDIEYNNSTGAFKIKVPGIYVIYSRLVFDSPSPGNHSPILFGQVIAEQSDEQDNRMLEDLQTLKCDPSNQEVPCCSSLVFSSLYLRRDLELLIMAKPRELLRSRNQASYFGLYKIDWKTVRQLLI